MAGSDFLSGCEQWFDGFVAENEQGSDRPFDRLDLGTMRGLENKANPIGH
jgi:hypothetical protein